MGCWNLKFQPISQQSVNFSDPDLSHQSNPFQTLVLFYSFGGDIFGDAWAINFFFDSENDEQTANQTNKQKQNIFCKVMPIKTSSLCAMDFFEVNQYQKKVIDVVLLSNCHRAARYSLHVLKIYIQRQPIEVMNFNMGCCFSYWCENKLKELRDGLFVSKNLVWSFSFCISWPSFQFLILMMISSVCMIVYLRKLLLYIIYVVLLFNLKVSCLKS